MHGVRHRPLALPTRRHNRSHRPRNRNRLSSSSSPTTSCSSTAPGKPPALPTSLPDMLLQLSAQCGRLAAQPRITRRGITAATARRPSLVSGRRSRVFTPPRAAEGDNAPEGSQDSNAFALVRRLAGGDNAWSELDGGSGGGAVLCLEEQHFPLLHPRQTLLPTAAQPHCNSAVQPIKQRFCGCRAWPGSWHLPLARSPTCHSPTYHNTTLPCCVLLPAVGALQAQEPHGRDGGLLPADAAAPVPGGGGAGVCAHQGAARRGRCCSQGAGKGRCFQGSGGGAGWQRDVGNRCMQQR